MSKNNIKLTVIMPVYNEEESVAYALESVIYQNTDFEYEIIVIDDYSTDKTVSVIQSYQKSFDRIKLFVNDMNYGKGYSFMRGYEAASGKYFHVLDGDDFFINYDKLQKQVDFLDENQEYVAIGHNTAILFSDQFISFISRNSSKTSFSYESCIENKFYCHTSSYMYRKIEEKLPEFFLEKPMRGDSAVFFYHVYKTKKKVMYFPDIASVYHFHGNGIWSGLEDEKKIELNKEILKAYMDRVIIDPDSYEYLAVKERYEWLSNATQEYRANKSTNVHYDEILKLCRQVSSKVFAPEIREKAFQGMHGLRFVDQLCETIGRILMFESGYLLKDRVYDNNKVAILISGLVPSGGGIFKELKELVRIHLEEGKTVYIFSSNIINTEIDVFETHFCHSSINVWKGESDKSYITQLKSLIDSIYEVAPAKLYPFITHHDVISCAAIQKGLAKSIIVDYVYDHGTSLGISNSSIDKFILKTESQINALAPTIPARKFLYIPPFLTDHHFCNPYIPLKNGVITTASAAARSYKVESEYEYNYHKIIPNVLKLTMGVHYHYGPLTERFKKALEDDMRRLAVNPGQFIHIEWADQFSNSLLENGVDVFISPFPVCSARIAIEVMSCGIPLINHMAKNPKLPQAADFCDPNQWSWSKPNDLYKILRSLNAESLKEKSKSARSYFESNNEYNVAKMKIIANDGKEFSVKTNPQFILNDIQETDFYLYDDYLFSDSRRTEKPNIPVAIAGEYFKITHLPILISQIRYRLRLRTRLRNLIGQVRFRLKVRTRFRKLFSLFDS